MSPLKATPYRVCDWNHILGLAKIVTASQLIVIDNSVKVSSFNDLSKALFPDEDGEREEIAEEAKRAHDQQEDALDPKLDLEKRAKNPRRWMEIRAVKVV